MRRNSSPSTSREARSLSLYYFTNVFFNVQIFDEYSDCFLFSYESNSGGEREIQRTMLELLNQLDGFDSRGDVKVRLKALVFDN